jgi:YHS domain-containing protein
MFRSGLLVFFVLVLTIAGWSINDKALTNSVSSVIIRSVLTNEIGTSVTCVVDGMKFTLAKNSKVAEYKGKAYYFCANSEIPGFQTDPEKYLVKQKKGGMGKKDGMNMSEGGGCN